MASMSASTFVSRSRPASPRLRRIIRSCAWQLTDSALISLIVASRSARSRNLGSSRFCAHAMAYTKSATPKAPTVCELSPMTVCHGTNRNAKMNAAMRTRMFLPFSSAFLM